LFKGTYNLTGEKEPRNRVLVPLNPFEWGKGYGAWQVAVRYEHLHINPNTLNAGLATGANDVRGSTIGINWILNSFVLARLDWQYLTFNRGILVSDHVIHHESLITGRIQAAF
jgi:phosphate-selective porin OprO/OprP